MPLARYIPHSALLLPPLPSAPEAAMDIATTTSRALVLTEGVWSQREFGEVERWMQATNT